MSSSALDRGHFGRKGDAASICGPWIFTTMRRREDEVLQAIAAAHAFIGRHAQLATVSQAGAYLELGEVLARVRDNAVGQVSGTMARKSATEAALAARESLMEQHMSPIASIADVLVERRPEVTGIRMPKSYLASEQLIAYARGMASAAERFKDDFVEAGLPTDFLEQMEESIQHFGAVSVQPKQHHARRKGATHGVGVELSRARKLLKVMDSFVRREVRGDQALMAEWKVVKRLPRPKKASVALTTPQEPLALPAPQPPLQAIARIAEEEEVLPSRWSLRKLLPRLR